MFEMMVRFIDWKWTAVSATLLLIYLTFFHICLQVDATFYPVAGMVSWLTWCVVCFLAREVFSNRFEFLIHFAVGSDLFIEGFIPYHDGLGFYFCALSFWSVFLIYRFVFLRKSDAVLDQKKQFQLTP